MRLPSRNKLSISTRGMPKFVSLDDSISLKANLVKLKRASFSNVGDIVRLYSTVNAVLWGVVVTSACGLAPAPVSPLTRKILVR
jgi:hypothetical protein